jgi:L-Ala-D/L-Glu epimerase
MKIDAIRTHVVSVPYRTPETWRYGRVWGVTNVIVEVETDEGLVGLGETPGNPAVTVIRSAVEAMGEFLVGEDPCAINRIARLIRERGWHHYPYVGNQAAAAIEMALWDILGKARGCPVSALLGGAVRDHVPFYWYLPARNRDVKEVADEAAAGVERGFGTVYLKAGFETERDIALIRSIREAVGPDVAVRADANEGWTLHEASRVLWELEDVGLEFIEQPIDMNDVEGLLLLRQRTRTPIGANQTAWLEHKVLQLIAARAADVIVTDFHQLGGLLAFARAAGMCEVARVAVVKHSFGDLGITTAAALHQLSTLHGPALAHQTHLELLEHDLVTERFEFSDGGLQLPSRPGLGVELDRDALEHYKGVYESVGEFSGYAPLDGSSPLSDVAGAA